MRIVQVANFVTPSCGGLRTTLQQLAQGYAARGHEVVQVLPGPHDEQRDMPWGRQVLLRAPAIPGTGYRLMLEPKKVQRALGWLAPEALEVHDRTTLRGLGSWAHREGVPSLVVSHERLDRWMGQWVSPMLVPLDALADRSNAALAAAFGTVVCTTSWAGQEFRRVHADNLVTIPLGVDLTQFAPRLSARPAGGVVLVMVSRLSREKRPELAIDALREMRRRGIPARLVVAGDGPMRKDLAARARGLPVHWCGFVQDRADLASLLSAADVVLAPGPVESFGLAALEAMSCGVPAIGTRVGGVMELITDGEDGFVEAVGDVAGQAARAVQLLTDEGLHGRMAAAARNTALTRFCTEKIIPMYEDYYRDVLGR